MPDGLDAEVDEHVGRLEERAGKRFGDPSDPLLVSVRSGAAVSMPGMMDTILNLGLNDVAVEGLARTTGNARFARDSYRRLIQMFGEVVEGIDGHRFEQSLADLKSKRRATHDTDLTAEDLAELIETYKATYEESTGDGFPQDARDQLRRAVSAVFDSWGNTRAQVYRRAHRIPDDLGTAVNVVQMVFGNKGEDCGTGVCFTRDPSTGEPGLYGEFLANAQGEDVVAGIRTPEPLEAMQARLPDAYEQLLDTMRRLEEHYRDMQDIEFTVEEGQLYLLQTRSAKRTAAAALKAAVDMVDEGLISREDAIARIDPAQLDQLLHPMLDPNEHYDVAATGLNASPGAASGKVVFDADTAVERGRARRRDPRALGDDAGRHPRDDRGEGDPHRARRHDLARGGRGARDGQAVRRRLRGALARPEARGVARIGEHELREGDQLTIDGGTGRVIVGAVRLVPPQINEDFQTVLGVGRRRAPAEGARERRHAGGRRAGTRVRR